ncbi:PITH domain protein [Gregarina niphandrodes]|uniref:PITH domain protein n=1 Tax=Gregarina niphandrodes TaxID=110365 RepID=A0A023BD55_GRENI|nr:PITH domain protein [Gregarina niphandrodes]EZG87444.1 PITH domain protein [Gregarina niphandrodes]|eukprot:XP_011128649.1 PITH domain protein [Gregarina niphandrodes]
MRDHSERFNTENVVVSFDADDDDCHEGSNASEVLLSVHFTNPVKLHSIVVLCTDDNSVPDSMRLFSEQPHLDLSTADDTKPLQELTVAYDPCGVLEHPVKLTRFNDITSLQIHFVKKTPHISLRYIGIKGEATKHQRRAVATVYESKPNIADHQVDNVNLGRMGL